LVILGLLGLLGLGLLGLRTNKDEIISDAFNIQEIDDIIYEVDCKAMMVNPGYL
jgi:Translationally controlled tumour protein